ncbi:MAG: CheR family methyltransferase [Myxococcota bacterium]
MENSGLLVVGVGASAGGLESLERLFRSLTRTGAMTFVVIQHLSPDFKSVMDELLARYTDMEVLRAVDGLQLEADHVYLLSPRKELEVRDGRVRVFDRPSAGLSFPIDRFFMSLAETAASDAVAVILSGSGSDGSRGAERVRDAGGLVIAEDPSGASFDGMPRAVIDAQIADLVLKPEAIARALVERARGTTERGDSMIAERIIRALRQAQKIDFSEYKRATVYRRIRRRMELHQDENLEAYAERLDRDEGELEELCRDLLIGVTEFFRDSECFTFIEREVIPGLIRRATKDELRIWVAGCATGQEAYSLAILFDEALINMDKPMRVRIFATDIHQTSLSMAGSGIFPAEHLDGLSDERRERYFEALDSGLYRVTQQLRNMVVFAAHNLLRDAPFTNLDMVTCRNMLIYFKPQAQHRALEMLSYGLRANGVLFLGKSEHLGPYSTDFEAYDERLKVYRKQRALRRLPRQFVLPPVTQPKSSYGETPEPPLLEVYDALLDEFMPPSFLVDQNRRLIDSFGNVQELLRFNRRRPSSDLAQLIPDSARMALTGAISRVARGGPAVRLTGLPWHSSDEGETRFTMAVKRVATSKTQRTRFLVTLLEEAPVADQAAASASRDAVALHDLSRERVATLEAELSHARESLQATVEELETSNEELQATNEELVASNEELQSTNEELHSVNEELHSVNAEYQRKIDELSELNQDFRHLLDGMDVGTIFLDRDLRIRRFTPRAAALFNLVEHDIGRRLAAFSHGLAYPSLLDDMTQVAESGQRIEREAKDHEGNTLFVRLLPYRTIDGVAGVVVTFTDISALAAERQRADRLSALVDSNDDAIIGHQIDGIVTSWNSGAEALYGYKADEMVGQSIRATVPDDRWDELQQVLVKIAQGHSVVTFETMRKTANGVPLEISATVSPIRDHDGRVIGAAAIDRDVREYNEILRRLLESERKYQDLYDNAPEMYVSVDMRAARIIECNALFLKNTGYSREEVANLAIFDIYATESLETARRCFERVRNGDDNVEADLTIVRKDRSELHVELSASGVRDDSGQVIRSRSVLRDISARLRAEQALATTERLQEQFLGMVAHELRNPLHIAQTGLTLLGQVADDPEQAAQARATALRQLGHMSRIVEDLVDVSRIREDKFGLQLSALDLREVVRGAADGRAAAYRAAEVELSTTYDDHPVPVQGDADRLAQCVYNLLSNALRFSKKHQVVELKVRARGDNAELFVRDQGKGIPQDELSSVFELFYQVDPGLARAHGGLGVGLYITRRIVVAHGGTIEVYSDGVDRGATFVIKLPLHKADLSADEQPSAKQRSKSTIVLVEDLDDGRELLAMALRRAGHEVFSAGTGKDGLSLILKHQPDVAFIDIGLPDIDGYEVARRVWAAGLEVLLVAVTGYGREADRQTAMNAGFTHHFTKPIALEDLLKLIEDHQRR